MSAVRAALLPHPPLLLPELAGGAASELDPLRAACRKAIDDVLGASGALVVIGDGPVWGIAARAAVGSFQRYGAAVEVRLPEERLWADLPGLPEPHRLDELPLSLAIAAWLLAAPSVAAASPGGDRRLQSAEVGEAALAEVDVRPGEEERVQSAAAPAVRPGGAGIRPSKGLRAAGAGEPPAAGPAAAAPGGADVSPGKGRGLHVVRTGEPPAVIPPGAATPASADASEGEGGAQVAGVAEMPALARARWVGSPAGGPGDEGGEAGNGDFPPLVACTIPATLGPGAAAAVGRTLVEMAAAHGPVGVIAMADLSARRTAAAPGAYHPAAATFDAGIADALAGGDLDALATIDPVEAAELLVGGRVVLQALAEAMRGGTPPSGHVLYDQAPYGGGYLVAVLTSLAEAAPPAGTRAR